MGWAVGYRIRYSRGSPPRVAGCARAGSGPQSRPRRSSRLPPPLRTSRSPAAQDAVYSTGEVLSALAWDSGRREGGGSGSQHAGPGAAASSLRLSRLPLGSGTGWRGRGAGSRRVRESVRFLRFVCGIESWIPGVDPNGGCVDPLLSRVLVDAWIRYCLVSVSSAHPGVLIKNRP